jgi:hypothetical protein
MSLATGRAGDTPVIAASVLLVLAVLPVLGITCTAAVVVLDVLPVLAGGTTLSNPPRVSTDAILDGWLRVTCASGIAAGKSTFVVGMMTEAAAGASSSAGFVDATSVAAGEDEGNIAVFAMER